MSLPTFRYHPDPLASGAIVPSDTECECCGEARGYIYTGPTFCDEDLVDCLCPWCIADGSAHEEFQAEFTDASAIGGEDQEDPLPDSVIEEVAYQTPGFSGCQQEHWLTCCGDAAAYLGNAGHTELENKWPEAIPAVKATSGTSGAAWDRYFASLDLLSGPTAYVFQCLHCHRHLAYSDNY